MVGDCVVFLSFFLSKLRLFDFVDIAASWQQLPIMLFVVYIPPSPPPPPLCVGFSVFITIPSFYILKGYCLVTVPNYLLMAVTQNYLLDFWLLFIVLFIFISILLLPCTHAIGMVRCRGR